MQKKARSRSATDPQWWDYRTIERNSYHYGLKPGEVWGLLPWQFHAYEQTWLMARGIDPDEPTEEEQQRLAIEEGRRRGIFKQPEPHDA